jgi:hypothetical protein
MIALKRQQHISFVQSRGVLAQQVIDLNVSISVQELQSPIKMASGHSRYLEPRP